MYRHLEEVTVRWSSGDFPDTRLAIPVMIAAFGGWNDAGEAATGAISHLASIWPATTIAQVDPENFYDFQVNRPTVFLDGSKTRQLIWPATEVFGVATPHLPFDLVLVKGLEPSMRWRSFTADLLDLADDLDVATLITVGSLLADTPHSRSIPVSRSAAHPDIAERLGVEVSGYEGPTGIRGIAKCCIAPRNRRNFTLERNPALRICCAISEGNTCPG